MSDQELRDEPGHGDRRGGTRPTATALAWAFERLATQPAGTRATEAIAARGRRLPRRHDQGRRCGCGPVILDIARRA